MCWIGSRNPIYWAQNVKVQITCIYTNIIQKRGRVTNGRFIYVYTIYICKVHWLMVAHKLVVHYYSFTYYLCPLISWNNALWLHNWNELAHASFGQARIRNIMQTILISAQNAGCHFSVFYENCTLAHCANFHMGGGRREMSVHQQLTTRIRTPLLRNVNNAISCGAHQILNGLVCSMLVYKLESWINCWLM